MVCRIWESHRLFYYMRQKNRELCMSFPSLHSPPALAQRGSEPCSIYVCLHVVSRCVQHPRFLRQQHDSDWPARYFRHTEQEKKRKKKTKRKTTDQRGTTSLLKVQWGAHRRAMQHGFGHSNYWSQRITLLNETQPGQMESQGSEKSCANFFKPL